MPEKRKRRSPQPPQGLAAGEKLNRDRLGAGDIQNWGWVGSQVRNASEITQEHRLAACGLSERSQHPFCSNKFAPQPAKAHKAVETELDDDGIIVISDNEEINCSKKHCRNNPNCLNYLGQEIWENEDAAREEFFKAVGIGKDPSEDRRDPNLPVGLKNLGATCYANAFLQVWFQNLAFRSGVYSCQPSVENVQEYEDSPIFQLQVTFAALQTGNQRVFNPIKLVESLQLRTSEQQDAQEFSKLFMNHLDSEFKKQANPALRSLISKQFEGKVEYVTVCESCSCQSAREATFLELEVNLEDNAKLEDRLQALFATERLIGDNRYLCSRCETLRNAARYTRLLDLPPVLHISLLRFVYDTSTMARKKSKQTISFPRYLDMNRYLQDPCDSKSTLHEDVPKYTYECRGVLLHKGPSAYHGHYEAQVFDVASKEWYQFNDEVVTRMPAFHLSKTSKTGVGLPHSGGWVKNGRSRKNTYDKRRIEDSDENDEIVVEEPKANTQYLSSRDAYMLIYARCDNVAGIEITPPCPPISSSDTSSPSGGTMNSSGCAAASSMAQQPIPYPPDRATTVVTSLNDTIAAKCHAYNEKAKDIAARFTATRMLVLEIYRSWSLSSSADESVIVGRGALEKWLRGWFLPLDSKRDKIQENNNPPKSVDPEDDFPERFDLEALRIPQSGEPRSPFTSSDSDLLAPRTRTIANSDIFCHHCGIDPLKGGDIKRIRVSALEAMVKGTRCAFVPEPVTTDNICNACVEAEFIERLYQIEHPRLVLKFNEKCKTDGDSDGYWISKQWIKDWRLAKPKMHNRSGGDPPPDSIQFLQHVQCEHGGLPLAPSSRIRISHEGVQLLRTIYPSWNPPAGNSELCLVCDAIVHISKEDKLAHRKSAENEKTLLKRLYENDVTSAHTSPPETPCAIIPAQFIRDWRSWLARPSECMRPGPETIDNRQFVCEHGHLKLNPMSDLGDNASLVSMVEWETITKL